MRLGVPATYSDPACSILSSLTFFHPEAGVPLPLRYGLVSVRVAVHLNPLPAQPQLGVALQLPPERLQLAPRYDLKMAQFLKFLSLLDIHK